MIQHFERRAAAGVLQGNGNDRRVRSRARLNVAGGGTVNIIGRGITALTLVFGLSTACASQSNQTLVFTIEQTLATSPAAADFGRAVEGDWDRVCIFRPGNTYERVDSVIGARWPASRETGLETGDDATLIAFVRGSTVVSHVMYPIAKGDFGTPGPEQWYCRARDRAVFELRQPIDGRIPWIGPATKS